MLAERALAEFVAADAKHNAEVIAQITDWLAQTAGGRPRGGRSSGSP